MILPDSRCETHGEMFVVYQTVNRGQPIARTYCRACRRERARQRNGGMKRLSPLSDRCKNGHPKTVFNYGMYGGKKQCIVCAKERGRHKR